MGTSESVSTPFWWSSSPPSEPFLQVSSTWKSRAASLAHCKRVLQTLESWEAIEYYLGLIAWIFHETSDEVDGLCRVLAVLNAAAQPHVSFAFSRSMLARESVAPLSFLFRLFHQKLVPLILKSEVRIELP